MFNSHRSLIAFGSPLSVQSTIHNGVSYFFRCATRAWVFYTHTAHWTSLGLSEHTVRYLSMGL